VFILILTGLKIPCFKFGANVRTLYELTNTNFHIIFPTLLDLYFIYFYAFCKNLVSVYTSKNKYIKYGMKKLKTSGCLFSKSDSRSGNKKRIAKIIFKNVSPINKLKMFVLPEEYL